MPTKRREQMLEKLGTLHRNQSHVSKNRWFNEHTIFMTSIFK